MLRSVAFLLAVFGVQLSSAMARAEFQAGAAIVEITPSQFPVLVNGGMLSNTASGSTTPIHARAIVVDDGHERIGIVVVDSCMMPRPFLDETKQLAARRTKIQPNRMLISATHTHSAPSVMGALGTDADENYIPLLRARIGDALVAAERNLAPAEVGWAVGNAEKYTALRRWIIRPDRMQVDPFGNKTMRANMHAANKPDDVTGPSGPEDPDLSLLAFRHTDGTPLAVLANFSMHYFSGEKPLSADYFGLYCGGLQKAMPSKPKSKHPPFVAAMSHGCSGDIWRRDYALQRDQWPNWKIQEYTDGLLKISTSLLKEMTYTRPESIAMEETRIPLNYRVPDFQRLEWAKQVVAELGEEPPQTRPQVYAREQIILHELQSTQVVVQAIRMGNIGLVTTPNETYALTGLKLKRRSPLPNTMVIELANGGDGYIPPPEQHHLGGYNTWAARSAGLEVQAEPKIAAAGLHLLENVAGQPRKPDTLDMGPASDVIKQLRPIAWYRMNDMGGQRIRDASDHGMDGFLEPGYAFYLPGPVDPAFCSADMNRSIHFAGGRLCVRLPKPSPALTVSMWFWNGMPDSAREISGWLFGSGDNFSMAPNSIAVGIGGTKNSNRLLLRTGAPSNDKFLSGKTKIDRWTWNHLSIVLDGKSIRVLLNGREELTAPHAHKIGTADGSSLFFAGDTTRQNTFEGRLDEIVILDRAFTPAELERLGGVRPDEVNAPTR